MRAEAEAAEEDPRNEAYRAPRFHHSALPSLVFLGFLIYAVARSHTDDVNTACGPSLWKYIVVRLVLSCCGSLLVFCCTVYGYACSGDMAAAAGCGTALLIIAYGATIVGVGVPIVSAALASPQCVTALSASVFTQTPILAIMGCIFIGVDALMLFIAVGAMCCGLISGCQGYQRC